MSILPVMIGIFTACIVMSVDKFRAIKKLKAKHKIEQDNAFQSVLLLEEAERKYKEENQELLVSISMLRDRVKILTHNSEIMEDMNGSLIARGLTLSQEIRHHESTIEKLHKQLDALDITT